MDSPSLNQALATHQSLSPITASLALPHLPLALALGDGDGGKAGPKALLKRRLAKASRAKHQSPSDEVSGGSA